MKMTQSFNVDIPEVGQRVEIVRDLYIENDLKGRSGRQAEMCKGQTAVIDVVEFNEDRDDVLIEMQGDHVRYSFCKFSKNKSEFSSLLEFHMCCNYID